MCDSWYYICDAMAEEDLNEGLQPHQMEWAGSDAAEQEDAVQHQLNQGLEADVLMEQAGAVAESLAALWEQEGPSMPSGLGVQIATAAEDITMVADFEEDMAPLDELVDLLKSHRVPTAVLQVCRPYGWLSIADNSFQNPDAIASDD